MMQAIIEVHNENGPCFQQYPDGGAEAQRTIKIVYREAGNGKRNHYDSIVYMEDRERGRDTQSTTNTTSPVVIGTVDRRIDQMLSEMSPGQYELMQSSQTISPRQATLNPEETKIATWNVRGSSRQEKREAIDQALATEGVDIACLQETRLTTGKAETENYRWFLSGGKNQSTRRGVAVLINKSSQVQFKNFSPITENICTCTVEDKHSLLSIIGIHLPSDKRSTGVIAQLYQVVEQCTRRTAPILAGDFNAQIGKEDLTAEDKKLIGPRLLHNKCNTNGQAIKDLAQLFQLPIQNTWSTSRTVLTTWSNKVLHSQIDHFLAKRAPPTKLQRTTATWIEEVNTDHKLLTTVIKK